MSSKKQRLVKDKLDDGSYVFDRESLCEKEIVQYVCSLVENGVGIAVTPLNVQQLIQSQYQTTGGICLFEVATAMEIHLSDFNCTDDHYSTKMENDIHRHQYEQ